MLEAAYNPIRHKLPCESEYGCLIIGLGRTRSEINRGANMPHAIVIGANGRRHEVDFENAEVTIEVFSGETTIEIVIEAPNDLAPSHRKRFALLNLPREQFSAALGHAAQRKSANKTRAVP
jgi:hypothetical protein